MRTHLRTIISHDPIDDKTNAMSREKSHCHVAEPYVILNATLRRETEQW